MSTPLYGMSNLLVDYIRTARYTSNPQLRVHGNGFIQLDVDRKTRLHFWGDPRIPRQRVDSGWHDHAFSAFSTVLKGEMHNLCYKAEESPVGQYYAYHPTRRQGTEDTTLAPHGTDTTRFDLALTDMFTIREGETYGFAHGQVHYSSARVPTITLMKKMDTAMEPFLATVFCPIGLQPDNDFNRDAFPQELLWAIVDDMVNW